MANFEDSFQKPILSFDAFDTRTRCRCRGVLTASTVLFLIPVFVGAKRHRASPDAVAVHACVCFLVLTSLVYHGTHHTAARLVCSQCERLACSACGVVCGDATTRPVW